MRDGFFFSLSSVSLFRMGAIFLIEPSSKSAKCSSLQNPQRLLNPQSYQKEEYRPIIKVNNLILDCSSQMQVKIFFFKRTFYKMSMSC